MFEFIKAVSDTVLDAINAVCRGKPLLVIKAVSDTAFDMTNAVYHEELLMFRLIKAVSPDKNQRLVLLSLQIFLIRYLVYIVIIVIFIPVVVIFA